MSLLLQPKSCSPKPLVVQSLHIQRQLLDKMCQRMPVILQYRTKYRTFRAPKIPVHQTQVPKSHAKKSRSWIVHVVSEQWETAKAMQKTMRKTMPKRGGCTSQDSKLRKPCSAESKYRSINYSIKRGQFSNNLGFSFTPTGRGHSLVAVCLPTLLCCFCPCRCPSSFWYAVAGEAASRDSAVLVRKWGASSSVRLCSPRMSPFRNIRTL